MKRFGEQPEDRHEHLMWSENPESRHFKELFQDAFAAYEKWEKDPTQKTVTLERIQDAWEGAQKIADTVKHQEALDAVDELQSLILGKPVTSGQPKRESGVEELKHRFLEFLEVTGT